ncbi:MAG: hypothetical protein KDD53_08420 [Bdellovibrionales bacterium]|nr:hypothetical protein [Bdellovibrionales bacterium]
MKLITLKEFRYITKVSNETIISLLDSGTLAHSISDQGQVLIDIDSVTSKNLVQAISSSREAVFQHWQPLLEEVAARIIRENFESIASQAVANALSERQ